MQIKTSLSPPLLNMPELLAPTMDPPPPSVPLPFLGSNLSTSLAAT